MYQLLIGLFICFVFYSCKEKTTTTQIKLPSELVPYIDLIKNDKFNLEANSNQWKFILMGNILGKLAGQKYAVLIRPEDLNQYKIFFF